MIFPLTNGGLSPFMIKGIWRRFLYLSVKREVTALALSSIEMTGCNHAAISWKTE